MMRRRMSDVVPCLVCVGAMGLVAAVDRQVPSPLQRHEMRDSLLVQLPTPVPFTAVIQEALKLEELEATDLRLLDPSVWLEVPSSAQGGTHEHTTGGNIEQSGNH